jgi:tetratricopeptide (TPR) repeat protein
MNLIHGVVEIDAILERSRDNFQFGYVDLAAWNNFSNEIDYDDDLYKLLNSALFKQYSRTLLQININKLCTDGKLEESMKICNKVIENGDEDGYFYCLRAAIWMKMERYSKAREDILKADQLSKKNSFQHPYLIEIHHAIRAEVLLQFDKIDEAIESIGVCNLYGRSRLILSKCYLQQGKYFEALKNLEDLNFIKELNQICSNLDRMKMTLILHWN